MLVVKALSDGSMYVCMYLQRLGDANGGVALLNSSTYRNLLRTVPRNYTVFILFNRRDPNCYPCS